MARVRRDSSAPTSECACCQAGCITRPELTTEEAGQVPPTKLEQTVRALVAAFHEDKKLDVIGLCAQLGQELQDNPERTIPDEVMLLLSPEMRQTALAGMCLVALSAVGH